MPFPLLGLAAIDQVFAFMDLGTGSIKTFIYSTFLSHLRTCLSIIGIKPQQYAGHSFRRGGASFAYEAGLPIDMIKLISDWKSNAVLLYLTVSLKMRLHSSNVLTKQILQHLFNLLLQHTFFLFFFSRVSNFLFGVGEIFIQYPCTYLTLYLLNNNVIH